MQITAAKKDTKTNIFYYERIKYGITFGKISDFKKLFQPSSNYKTNGKINNFDIFTCFIVVISTKAETA